MIRVRPADANDAASITALHNQGIAERIAALDTQPRSIDNIRARIADTKYPLLVAVAPAGEVIGWAGLSCYRPRDCYVGVAEFSIYLDAAARGQDTASCYWRR